MITVISKFKKSIDHFTEKTHLRNIRSIAQDERLLKNLLGGYSAALSAGIAIYYLSEEPANTNCETLEVISSGETPAERLKFFHPICEKYRACQTHDDKCIEFDKEIALKYYRRHWKKPTLYRCHLGVLDMTYPIRVDGVLLGVLFAGQIVIKKGNVKWREVLKEITDNENYQVCWEPLFPEKEIPENSNHINDIIPILNRKSVSRSNDLKVLC